MRQLAQLPRVEPAASSPESASFGHLGGPVAAMHQSLADRLAADPIGLSPVPPETDIERTVRMLSRVAGPVALGLGYIVAARLMPG